MMGYLEENKSNDLTLYKPMANAMGFLLSLIGKYENNNMFSLAFTNYI